MDVPTIQLLDGPVLRMPHRREYPALSGRRYIELRNGIAKHGFVPGMGEILIDQHDNVIDGHHRLEVAKDLGMFWSAVPWRRIELRDEDHRREVVRQANLNRRHLTEKEHEERNARIRAKVDAGVSQRHVAREEGVAQSTVNAIVLGDRSADHLGSDLQTDPARKEEPTVETRAKKNRPPDSIAQGKEKRRRIAALLAEGRTPADIARALGTSQGNIWYHMKRMEEEKEGKQPPPAGDRGRRQVANAEQGREIRRRISAMLAEGKTRQQIADALGLTPAGVSYHLALMSDSEKPPAGVRERRRLAASRASVLDMNRKQRDQARQVARTLAAELKGQTAGAARDRWTLPDEKRDDLRRCLDVVLAALPADEDVRRALLPVSRAAAAVAKAYLG